MTDTAAAPARADARDLQAKLYREIGIAAVAAALRFTTQPEPATPPRPVGSSPENPRPARTLAA